VKLVRRHLDRILSLARIERTADLTPSAVTQAVGKLKADGLSAWSLNHAVAAAKAFSKWLKRDGRTADYTLETLTRYNVQADRRHVRRALTPEETARVIQAAESGRTVKNLTGPDRAMLYLVAAGTGFRRNELRTLTPESFNLDGDPPTVLVKAAFSKRRRDDVQPIPVALANRLRPWLATRPAGEPLFGRLTTRTAEMLRVDLEAAGVPYETSEGRADFHGTRVTYITNLVASGASVKTCQTLARHSDPSLTIGVYAKTSLHDVQGAVEALPNLAPQEKPPTEPLARTGTDPAPIDNRLAHPLPTGEDGPGRPETVPVVIARSNVPESMGGKSLENKASDGSMRAQTAPDATHPISLISDAHEPTVLLTVLKVPLMLEPRFWMMVMQATMIRASITAYSTAVGPSSLLRNRRILEVGRNMENPFRLALREPGRSGAGTPHPPPGGGATAIGATLGGNGNGEVALSASRRDCQTW
jgi:integrase